MKILICGTPGVGKTTQATILSQKLQIQNINVSDFIKENNLYEGYDSLLDTHEFDEDVVKSEIESRYGNEKGFIIETHTPEIVNGLYFDLVIVLKCFGSELHRRLKDRGYSAEKIQENLDYEMFCEAENYCNEEIKKRRMLVIDSAEANLTVEQISYRIEEEICTLQKEICHDSDS